MLDGGALPPVALRGEGARLAADENREEAEADEEGGGG